MTERADRRGSSGFTLAEVMVALLIVGLVVTTALAVFVERTRRLQEANDTILAYQSLQNEAEVRRRIDFSQLDDAQTTFLSDTALLEPLGPLQTHVSVNAESATVKDVTMWIVWHGGKQRASLRLIRVDTGGSNLW